MLGSAREYLRLLVGIALSFVPFLTAFKPILIVTSQPMILCEAVLVASALHTCSPALAHSSFAKQHVCFCDECIVILRALSSEAALQHTADVPDFNRRVRLRGCRGSVSSALVAGVAA